MNNLKMSAAVIGDDMLIGSSIQPSVYKVEGKPDVQLGTVVARAYELSGLTADDWNKLPDAEREDKIVAVCREWELPVYHQAQVQVVGAENMTLQQQADTIRLNPGAQGFSEEAHAKAAEDAANNVPLPEFTEHPIDPGAALQAQNNADAPATVMNPPAPATAGDASASIGKQNLVAAASTLPVEPELQEGDAFVETSPAGDGWLVKFWDKTEKHFFAELHELEAALKGYAHNVIEAKATVRTGE